MENKNKKIYFSKGKENFALDVSALSTYTDQISDGLAKELILNANTIKGDIVSKQYGAIGNAVQLNTLSNTQLAVTSACGTFTDTGSTILNKTTVNLCGIKFPKSICIDTLKQYYYDWYMDKSFNATNLGEFEDVFVQSNLESMSLAVDKMLWQGASTSPAYATVTGNNTLCNGFLQSAYASSASTVNVTRTAITQANAYVVLDSILASAAANAPALLEDFTVYLNPADFQNYLTALRGLNLFKYDTGEAGGIDKIHHPGSIGMTVQRTNGLQGATSGFFIATKKENIVAVISAEEDLNFKMWFSDDFDSLRMQAKIKFGTGFRQPELVLRAA